VLVAPNACPAFVEDVTLNPENPPCTDIAVPTPLIAAPDQEIVSDVLVVMTDGNGIKNNKLVGSVP